MRCFLHLGSAVFNLLQTSVCRKVWPSAFIQFPLSDLLPTGARVACGISVASSLFYKPVSSLEILLVDQMNAKGILYRPPCLYLLLMLYHFPALHFLTRRSNARTQLVVPRGDADEERPLEQVQPSLLCTHMHRAQAQWSICPHTLPYMPWPQHTQTLSCLHTGEVFGVCQMDLGL